MDVRLRLAASPVRVGEVCAAALSILVLYTSGCGMLWLSTRTFPGTASPSREPIGNGGAVDAHGSHEESARPSGPAFDQAKYDACLVTFEKNHAAWLPIDAVAKATMAKVRNQSPYVAVASLLKSYEKVDEASSVRQTGVVPAGAAYAKATASSGRTCRFPSLKSHPRFSVRLCAWIVELPAAVELPTVAY